MEPEVILKRAFTMSLLEICPNRLNCPGSQPGESPFFKYFEGYLRDIASVVPYESILCTVAHCNNQQVVKRCMSVIKGLQAKFPFSLMMYASLFVHTFKILHQGQGEALIELFDELPFEVCAYFSWSKAKYTAKNISSKAAVDSFSKGMFAEEYMFRPDKESLKEMVQDSLQQVDGLLEVDAVSRKTAADLYDMKYSDAGPSSKSELSVESPIDVLINRRKELHQVQNIDESALGETTSESEPYSRSKEEIVKIIKHFHKIHIDFCTRVLCGFVYPQVQVPFTEVNPMTFWSHLHFRIAPYFELLEDDSKHWPSLLKRCERVIAKGSKLTERTYHGKLKFLVCNADPNTKALTDIEYSMYMLEKELKKISEQKAIREKSIEQMVHNWQDIFKECPMANVVPSHRRLISRWIKWSLMIHELRLTLENHITIVVTGMANSGKTQLLRSLFGFDVS
jgi:hypothetical protein